MAQKWPSKRAKYAIQAAIEATPTPLEDLDILHHIESLVGLNQYRFVAAINHDFKESCC
jgi:hypothetical protein